MANQDNRIVARVLEGDTDAFALIVRRYQEVLYNLMVRTTGDREKAADLTQDTFLKAYARLETFQPDRRFFSWLYTIGLNVARDYTRRISRRAFLAGEEIMWQLQKVQPQLPGEGERRQIQRMALRDALDRLPLGYREILIMRFRKDLEIRELAAIFNLSESAAKMRLHRGMKMLKEQFNEFVEPDKQ